MKPTLTFFSVLCLAAALIILGSNQPPSRNLVLDADEGAGAKLSEDTGSRRRMMITQARVGTAILTREDAEKGHRLRLRLASQDCGTYAGRSEEHTSELQSRLHLV